MAQFCTECGKPLAEGAGFCTECGAKIVATQEVAVPPIEAAQSVMQEAVAVTTEPVQEAANEVQVAEPIPQPVMQMEEVAPPQPVQPVAPKAQEEPPKGKYAVAGTGAYFGFMFLFGIPIIGWLVCFICAFAMKNKNLKNYAKSRVIWFFIKAVFWVGIFFLLRWIGNMIIGFVEGFLESEFGGLKDIFEQFKGLTDGLGSLGELTDGLGELGNISDGLGDLGNLSESLGDLEGLTEGLEGLDNLPIE